LEAINLVKLSGIVAREVKFKQTPSGICHSSFWLVHNSEQNRMVYSGETKKSLSQQVKCSMQVIAIGDNFKNITRKIMPGNMVTVTGYLNERQTKNDIYLVLHASELELLDLIED